MATIKQLREALKAVDKKYDDETVSVWLPGSRVDLGGPDGTLSIRPGPAVGKFKSDMLIEGNLREGSVLGS